ncbi:MAG: hypothetical protein WC123_02540 [Bacilli bacterium]|nr:hypothetical protein [Bacilli bacterium]
MNKKLMYLCIFLVPIVIIYYLLIDNLIVTTIFLIITLYILYKYVFNDILTTKKYISKINEMQMFSISLVMQISSTPSLHEAFKLCSPYFSDNLQDIYFESEGDIDKFLSGLNSYFINQTFSVFVELIKIYDKNGGDFLQMSNSIVADISYKKTSSYELYKIKRRKIIEFLSMWLLSIACMLYMRIELSSYYLNVVKSNLLIIILVVISIFVYSLKMAFNSLSKINFEGEINDEKRK